MRQRCRSPWFLLFFALLTAAAALSLSPAAARACIWDTDTLAQEARAFPDLVSVITGRFPRNPPLFYEMRLRRAADQIAVNPDDLAAYDDAGAACDRLRRGDEAIGWMEKKRARLARLNPADPNVREHWYRYHANVGTFWAHRWLRTGAARERLGEMRTARDHIARAIALNPNAHFGRETYQLQIMDWLIDSRAAAPARSPAATKTGNADRYRDTSLSHYLRDRRKTVAVPPNGANASDAAIKGLAGLIVLGDAWESVDVFAALANLLGGQHASLAHLAKLRCRELINQGRRSFDPQAPPNPRYAHRISTNAARTNAWIGRQTARAQRPTLPRAAPRGRRPAKAANGLPAGPSANRPAPGHRSGVLERLARHAATLT